MINTRLIDEKIRISCSDNEVIGVDKLKRLFKTSVRFLEQNNNAPIIVDVGSQVRMSNGAQQIFDRWNNFAKHVTLVIIKW